MRVGYFSQDQEESLDYEATPFDHMNRALGPGTQEHKVRAQLGRFGFSRDRANLKVGVLSGGEKTRLLLALATRNAPHMLLLDEPTNHLDMDARESLIEAINDFEGAVVLVSHDTHLVKMIADQLWLVDKGTVAPFEGDIDEYQTKLLRERSARPAKEAQGEEAEIFANTARPRLVVSDKPKRGHLKRALEKSEKRSPISPGRRPRSRPSSPIPRPIQARRTRSPSCRRKRSASNASSPTPSTTGWSPRRRWRRLELGARHSSGAIFVAEAHDARLELRAPSTIRRRQAQRRSPAPWSGG